MAYVQLSALIPPYELKDALHLPVAHQMAGTG
jgi:hypothetical protein